MLGAVVVTLSIDTPTALQAVEYYHLDALGSVRAVTDADGNVISRHDFRPFGEELSPQYPPKDRKLFTGQERDFETGLDYFYARQLRTDLGRFTAPDPITDLAWTDGTVGVANAYTYVRSNPLAFVDPMGAQGEPILVHPSYWDRDRYMVWGPSGYYCDNCFMMSDTVTPTQHSTVGPTYTPMGAGVVSFFPGRGPMAGPGQGAGGAGQAAAANSGPTKPGFFSCTFTGRVGMSYLSFALDAVGVFPGGNDVVHGVQFGADVASAGISLYGDLAGAGLSAAGMGLELAKKGGLTMEVHGVELIPVTGNVISAGAALRDIFGSDGIIASYKRCFAGAE